MRHRAFRKPEETLPGPPRRWARALHVVSFMIVLLVPLLTLSRAAPPAVPTRHPTAMVNSVSVTGEVAQPDEAAGAPDGIRVLSIALVVPASLLALTLVLSAVERRMTCRERPDR